MNSQNAPNELLRPPKHPKRWQEASQQGPQRSTVDFPFLLRCFFLPSCAFGSTTLQYCPTNSPNRSTTVQETPEKAPKRTNRALETAQNLPGALTIAPRRPLTQGPTPQTSTSPHHSPPHTPPPPPQAAPRAPQALRKAPRKPQEPPKRHSNTPNLDRARARMASRTTAVDGPCQRHESSETAYRCQGSSKTAREHAKRVYRLPQIPSQSCSRKAAPERDSRLQARPGAVSAPFGALDRPCKSLLRNAVRAHHSSPPTRRSDITAAPLHRLLHSFLLCDPNTVQKSQKPFISYSRAHSRQHSSPLLRAASPIQRAGFRTISHMRHGVHQLPANGASNVY